MEHINWIKEGLEFFVNLYPVKKERDFMVIYKNATELVKKHAHASSAALLQLEDEITARLLYTSGNFLNDILDAQLLHQIISEGKIVIDNVELTAINAAGKIIVIPVNEQAFSGAFILLFPPDFEYSAPFVSFLDQIWLGLKETAMLIQTYYSIEQLTTRFNTILSTIPEGIVFVDDSGKQGWVNAAASRLLSIGEDHHAPVVIAAAMQQMRGKAINQQSILQEGAKLFSSPNQSIKNWEWIFGDPVTQVLHVSCVPAISANIKGRLWVFDDVTSIYMAQQQLNELNAELAVKRRIADDQNKAKSDFLANMSHEIRTPMNGVIGMASLMANTDLTEEQKDYLDIIRISGESLLSIINDILDFSKIESGKMELESAPVNVASVIEDTYDLLTTKANEKGLDLLYYIDPSVPSEILGDIIRLKQILTNLVSNGIKFTESGEILVTVSSIGQRDDIYNLEFSVKDTGIGIPEDKFHRLFETFSQVDSSTTRKYGGTGLGLTICQRLVSLMGGAIRVQSEPGTGSIFTFDIKVPGSRRSIHFNSKERVQPVQLQDKSVLLLDDNKTNLKILKTLCERWGMRPLTTDNYKDAIDALAHARFDIAIVDLLMPEKDGIEVSRILKQTQEHLPVILFSSAGYFPSDDPDAKNIFSAILNKPIKQSLIEKTIIEILSRSAPPKEKIPGTKPADVNTGSPISILVAEDNDINQKMILRALDKLGYKSDLAENGRVALEMLQKKAYQLVFMDVMMPEIDGYRATTTILEQYDKNSRPVIIAMTANALTGDREKILAHGMDDYISKPFNLDELRNKLEAWKPKLLAKL